MKKIMIFAVAVMAVATTFAAPTWAVLNTTGAQPEGGDPDVTGYINNYKAYFCSVSDAGSIFGGNTSYGDIGEYLQTMDNFAGSMSLLAAEARFLLADYSFDEGEYSFASYTKPSELNDGDKYVAVVTYAQSEEGPVEMYRVFGSSVAGGELIFDPLDTSVAGGNAGDWMTAPVPEPTSGLLLLLGVAGLVLKRKKA